jgi:hypothetical protein
MSAALNPIALPRVLILDPALGFATLAARLAELGWTPGEPAPTTAPAITGEPELATWSRGGRKPHLVYTLNPIALLRVLDMDTCPPLLRGLIADALPWLDEPTLIGRLRAPAAADRLHAVWALAELEAVAASDAIAALVTDTEPFVARAAEQAVRRLGEIAAARVRALAALAMVAEAAVPSIGRLDDPAFTATLTPTPADCHALFDAPFAEALLPLLDEARRRPPRLDPGARLTELEVHAANAGLLRFPNEASNAFPAGWRDIAPWLLPAPVWLCWRWSAPGEQRGVSADGLTRVGERWLWLPKLPRRMAPLLAEALHPHGLH